MSKSDPQAERERAAANGKPFAVPIDMPQWATGAPIPHLLQIDNDVFLIYCLAEHDECPELTLEDVQRAGGPPESVAVVHFLGCACTKMGTPNDEVLHGHALYGLGLEFYKPMVVQNSTWITELESINFVHRDYRPESWQNLRHYILPFQDCTFECVAEDFRVTIRHEGFPRLLWELSGGPLK